MVFSGKWLPRGKNMKFLALHLHVDMRLNSGRWGKIEMVHKASGKCSSREGMSSFSSSFLLAKMWISCRKDPHSRVGRFEKL
jgi:hypothetical protein